MSEYYLLLKEKYVTKNPCQKAKDLRSILKWQNNSHVCIKIANSVALPSERAENSNLLWLMFFTVSNFSFIISRIKKGFKVKVWDAWARNNRHSELQSYVQWYIIPMSSYGSTFQRVIWMWWYSNLLISPPLYSSPSTLFKGS